MLLLLSDTDSTMLLVMDFGSEIRSHSKKVCPAVDFFTSITEEQQTESTFTTETKKTKG
jgi:hypothetical protein